MSDHALALVPIESWAYASPELLRAGRSIDVGLLAEALIYYDKILVNFSNQPQLAELITWFLQRDCFPELLALISDGTIGIYEYSFASTAVWSQDRQLYILMNIQNERQKEPNTFEERFLYHESVQGCLQNNTQREALIGTLRGRVIEVKADEFGSAITNADEDHQNPQRAALHVQALVDEVYSLHSLGSPPEVRATLSYSEDRKQRTATYNIDFQQINDLLGPRLNFGLGKPLTAAAQSNRFLWSSARLGCDLYMPRPMSVLVGDKLYEGGRALIKSHDIVESLQSAVEFPDIRLLVNQDQLSFSEVMTIRQKARKFRDWLQSEAERDRDAIIAYHNEVAREAGYIRSARKTLHLFGLLGGSALGAGVGGALSGPAGVAVGAAAGTAVGYVSDLASRIGADWRPVVFGNWMIERIARVVREKESSSQ